MPGRGFALAVATVGGAGLAPVAPGTFGSAVALLVFVILSLLGPLLYALSVVAIAFLGVWAADVAERVYGRKDDERIVIDELAGQLVALAPLVVLGGRTSIALIVTGFVAFRLFDVWKPGPVRWAERRFEGGAGVVLDDVVAGVLAALAVGAIAVAGIAGTVGIAGT